MKRISKAEALRKLFIARSRYRPIVLAEEDGRSGSRIAGGAPAYFAEAPRCPRCRGALDYFLTIEADLVGEAVAQGRALSIFTCAVVDCRLRSKGLDASPPSVIAITHNPSPRASGEQGRRLLRGHLRKEQPGDRGDSSVEQCKLGGLVFQIQTSIAEDEKQAARLGLSFLLQMNEQDLGEHTTNLGFWGGEVYLFTRTNPATGLPTLEDGRLCWSYT